MPMMLFISFSGAHFHTNLNFDHLEEDFRDISAVRHRTTYFLANIFRNFLIFSGWHHL